MKISTLVLVTAIVLLIMTLYLTQRYRTQGQSSAKKSGILPSVDTSTPEGAILCLEEAYRAKGIERAVELKDFEAEAELMLQKVNPKFQVDKNIVSKTAETLELAFRKEMDVSGFPDFDGVESSFVARKEIREGLVEVTEITKGPDGKKLKDVLLVKKGPNGWRVITP